MTYEAWRASFQSSEQAARAAYETGIHEHARAEAAERRANELTAQLSASEEHIRGFPAHKAINDRDRRIQTETLDELIDSLTEVGGEITINGIQGYRDALARGDL